MRAVQRDARIGVGPDRPDPVLKPRFTQVEIFTSLPVARERTAANTMARDLRFSVAELLGARWFSMAHNNAPMAPRNPSLNQVPCNAGRAMPAAVVNSMDWDPRSGPCA